MTVKKAQTSLQTQIAQFNVIEPDKLGSHRSMQLPVHSNDCALQKGTWRRDIFLFFFAAHNSTLQVPCFYPK